MHKSRADRGCTERADEREAPAGASLTEEGQGGREFFVLVEGAVVAKRDGRKLADLGPGDWFGEIAILTYKPRTATVTAISPVRLLVISDRAFRRVVETTPRIALQPDRRLPRVRPSKGTHRPAHTPWWF
jgi:CRP-like cAMP-binding protein